MINDYVTIYRKDYIPKSVDRKDEISPIKKKQNEYAFPIRESFKHYLCLDPCDDKFSEEVDSYFGKALETYKGFKRFTNGEPINKNVIRRDQIFDGRSQYQVDYCDLEKEVADKEFRRKNAVVLPPDTNIPLTTQKSGYRQPISLNSRAYEPPHVVIPPNNLDPNYNLRRILKVVTGDSEVMAVIGKLGEKIISEELHGHIPKL